MTLNMLGVKFTLIVLAAYCISMTSAKGGAFGSSRRKPSGPSMSMADLMKKFQPSTHGQLPARKFGTGDGKVSSLA